MYLDPIASPREFLDAVVERGPLLLGGQWALPAQVGVMLSPRAARWWWLAACGLALLLSALLAPLLRRDRAARFLALGMVLSLLPACASLPQDRLLLLAGFGGAGLLAQLLAGLADGAGWLPRSRPWRAFASVGGAALAVLHLVLAPVGLTRAAGQVRLVGRVVGRSAESLPSGPDARERSAVIVQTPTAINCFFAAAILAATGGSPPAQILVLSPGLEATTLERTGEETLLVRPAGGYFLPPGTRAPGVPPRDIDPRYALPLLDRLFRDDRAWRQGERRDLPGVAVTVTRLTADGRPAEVEFRFAGGLTRPSLVWLRWESWAYVPFEPPPPGTSVTLPSPTARSSKAGVRRRQALAKGSPGVPAVGESSQATKHP